jgi:diguanylate cyclase (GGDEF)-like protein
MWRRLLRTHAGRLNFALTLLAVGVSVAAAAGIVTLAGEGEVLVASAVAGVCCALLAPWANAFVLRLLAELSQARDELATRAVRDDLTGVHNRRYFMELAERELARARRYQTTGALLLIDADHFKQVNDTHGHDVGDEVLKAVASCLKDMTRYHDVVARLGGEEFAVVTPNMDSELLGKFAERIRKAVANMSVLSGNVRLKITTSVGLAVWDRKETAEEFYRRADRQLYEAKRQGRNRVCA